MTLVRDLRRTVALRAYGAMRLLEGVQGALEDVEGAVGSREYGVAAYQGRLTALLCLSIRSLARAGEIQYDPGSPSFDYFAGLSELEAGEGIALANAALDVDDATAAVWLERLRSYVADTEASLGYGSALPVLRSPEGPFGILTVTRRWADLLDELRLPAFLGGEWSPPAAEE